MKICPSCNNKCADSIKYCPRCNRYLGNINSIAEKEYYKNQQSFSQPTNKLGVECPYCHSTNVKKISTASKAGGVALFGIFGLGRAGKQWHCTHCNSDF